MNLWDPSGAKGLNATERKRTKDINNRVAMGFSPSDDELEDEDSIGTTNADKNDEGNARTDSVLDEWDLFCKEFDNLEKKDEALPLAAVDMHGGEGTKTAMPTAQDDEMSDGFEEYGDDDSDEDDL